MTNEARVDRQSPSIGQDLPRKPQPDGSLQAIAERYAAAARVVALHLREFCDESLTYDEMIADAARRVAEELAANRACNRHTWKERALKAVDEIDTLCQAIEGHRSGALTNDGLWHYHEKARVLLQALGSLSAADCDSRTARVCPPISAGDDDGPDTRVGATVKVYYNEIDPFAA